MNDGFDKISHETAWPVSSMTFQSGRDQNHHRHFCDARRTRSYVPDSMPRPLRPAYTLISWDPKTWSPAPGRVYSPFSTISVTIIASTPAGVP